MSEGLASQLEGYARAYNSLHKDIARDFTLAASIIRSHAEALAQLDAAHALLREAGEALGPFTDIDPKINQRCFVELLVCPVGDAAELDWRPKIEAAKALSAKISTYLKDGRCVDR